MTPLTRDRARARARAMIDAALATGTTEGVIDGGLTAS